MRTCCVQQSSQYVIHDFMAPRQQSIHQQQLRTSHVHNVECRRSKWPDSRSTYVHPSLQRSTGHHPHTPQMDPLLSGMFSQISHTLDSAANAAKVVPISLFDQTVLKEASFNLIPWQTSFDTTRTNVYNNEACSRSSRINTRSRRGLTSAIYVLAIIVLTYS
jgi:hypothetical protein